MSIFRKGLGCAACSSLPQFRLRPCLTFHPWATNSLPHGHLHTHQSLPLGAALSTEIPVVLTVLPNIRTSRGSCRFGTFWCFECGSSMWQACFDNASHSSFWARGIQHRFISHPQLSR